MSGSFQFDEKYKKPADFNRASRSMLADMREETWGWVVYRTTYSSDPAFHRAVDILTSWIKDSVYRDINDLGVEKGDPTPNKELWARHKLTVIEDAATLDGATLDAVRAQFEAWGEAQGKRDRWPKYRACLVLDEAAVHRLTQNAMTAEEHLEQHGPDYPDQAGEWFIPVVEAFPELDVGDPDFEGWMNCSITALIRLWTIMGDGSYMGDVYCEVDDGVYW